MRFLGENMSETLHAIRSIQIVCKTYINLFRVEEAHSALSFRLMSHYHTQLECMFYSSIIFRINAWNGSSTNFEAGFIEPDDQDIGVRRTLTFGARYHLYCLCDAKKDGVFHAGRAFPRARAQQAHVLYIHKERCAVPCSERAR